MSTDPLACNVSSYMRCLDDSPNKWLVLDCCRSIDSYVLVDCLGLTFGSVR